MNYEVLLSYINPDEVEDLTNAVTCISKEDLINKLIEHKVIDQLDELAEIKIDEMKFFGDIVTVDCGTFTGYIFWLD